MPSETIWADRVAPERVVEAVPDHVADARQQGRGDRDPDRALDQPAQLDAAELAAQDHRLGDDAGGRRDRGRGDDPADAEGP